MSETLQTNVGAISWMDLTVENADEVKEFYQAVAGWEAVSFDMGGYNDYRMNEPETSKTVSGICHARGGNTGLPALWLIYITVADLDQSIADCLRLGGKVIAGPKAQGDQARYCVIQDPAGAVAALYQNL
ncbi:MAG: VOC family protein [Pyrinomonadaceae bacterium]